MLIICITEIIIIKTLKLFIAINVEIFTCRIHFVMGVA